MHKKSEKQKGQISVFWEGGLLLLQLMYMNGFSSKMWSLNIDVFETSIVMEFEGG